MPDGEARNVLYKKMNDIVAEECPWLFGVHRLDYRVIHGWVHNMKWNYIQFDIPKYLRVDPKQRAEMAPKL